MGRAFQPLDTADDQLVGDWAALCNFPFGVVLLSGSGEVVLCNARARDLLGTQLPVAVSRRAPDEEDSLAVLPPLSTLFGPDGAPVEGRAAFEVVTEHEAITVAVTSLRLLRTRRDQGLFAWVLEDVSEWLFDGFTDDDDARSPGPTLTRFTPPSALRPGFGRRQEFVHQLLECLLTPTMVVDGTPARVTWSNAAARALLDGRIGQVVTTLPGPTPDRIVVSLTHLSSLQVEVVAVPIDGVGRIAVFDAAGISWDYESLLRRSESRALSAIE